MKDNEFWSQTDFGEYYGVSRVQIGKVLKDVGLRSAGGKPTPKAMALGLAEEREGPEPWITYWVWHKDKTCPFLEAWGLVPKEKQHA